MGAHLSRPTEEEAVRADLVLRFHLAKVWPNVTLEELAGVAHVSHEALVVAVEARLAHRVRRRRIEQHEH